MSNQVNAKAGLSVKDLVTTGIFTALLFVFIMVGGVFFATNPVLTFFMPAGSALLAGPIYLLMIAKVHKRWSVTIRRGRPRRPRHPLRLSALHARSHVDGRSHPDRSRAGHPDDRRLDRPQDQPQVSFLARPAPQSGAAVLHFMLSAGGCSSMAEQ